MSEDRKNQCCRIISEQELDIEQVEFFLETVRNHADVMLVDVEEDMIQYNEDDGMPEEVEHFSMKNEDDQLVYVYEISTEEIDQKTGDKIAEELFHEFEDMSFSFEATMNDVI